jgi:hypothetical protein
VPYALASKRLEDGSSAGFYTLTTSNDVSLATSPAAHVGVGYLDAAYKLNVLGDAKVTGKLNVGGIDWTNPSVFSVDALSADTDAVITSATNTISGDIIFKTHASERARILFSNGYTGIGTAAPGERLEVNGNISNSAGNLGLLPQDRLVIRSKDAAFPDGMVRLYPANDAAEHSARMELYSLSNAAVADANPSSYNRAVMGVTSSGFAIATEKGGSGADRPIYFQTGGVERARITETGKVGIGVTSPVALLTTATDGYFGSGARAGDISIGSYTSGGWTGAFSNEIRARDGMNMVLMYNTTSYVGIGTTTPQDKLHVQGNIRAAYGGFLRQRVRGRKPERQYGPRHHRNAFVHYDLRQHHDLRHVVRFAGHKFARRRAADLDTVFQRRKYFFHRLRTQQSAGAGLCGGSAMAAFAVFAGAGQRPAFGRENLHRRRRPKRHKRRDKPLGGRQALFPARQHGVRAHTDIGGQQSGLRRQQFHPRAFRLGGRYNPDAGREPEF